MWKTFNNGEDLYMIKIKHEETVEVLLTDLKNLWLENLSTERLLEKFQVYTYFGNVYFKI